jgi:hypothetical protein
VHILPQAVPVDELTRRPCGNACRGPTATCKWHNDERPVTVCGREGVCVCVCGRWLDAPLMSESTFWPARSASERREDEPTRQTVGERRTRNHGVTRQGRSVRGEGGGASSRESTELHDGARTRACALVLVQV